MNTNRRTIVLAFLAVSVGAGLTWTKLLRPSPVVKKASRTSTKRPTTVSIDDPSAQVKADQAPEETPAVPAESPPAGTPPDPDPRAAGWRGHLLHHLDQDGDHRLTAAEVPKRYRGTFMQGDKDGDGALDLDEFSALLDSGPQAEAAPSEPRRQTKLLTPPPPGKRMPVYVPKTGRNQALPDWFQKLDKDADGQLGVYEWPIERTKELRKLDANGDGLLTPAEVGVSKAKEKKEPPPPKTRRKRRGRD